MKLKKKTVELIVNYLTDISKIIFGGIIFSNIFMEKYLNTFLAITGVVFSIVLFIIAIILKNKGEM